MKKRILATMLVVLLFLAGCGAAPNANNDDDSALPHGQDTFSDAILPYKKESNKDFLRAVWVSYLDIVPIMSTDQAIFAANIEKMLDNLEKISVTDIYFQVRAFGDSIYPSGVYPSASETIYNMSGDIDYLAVVIERTHARSMKLHAWINPYRLHGSSSEVYQAFVDKLCQKDYNSVERTANGRTLNPASEIAQNLVIDGVKELLDHYDIDGIHFDDYFYPTTDEGFDAAYYNTYKESGGELALDAWRRGNVTKIVKSVHDLVKEKSSGKQFGISPDGSIARNQATHYVDVELFCKTEGYIDYICPQLYYGYKNDAMPFLQTVAQWSKLSEQCALIIGLSFYKVGTEDAYAGAGSGEWLESFDIISRQYLDSLEITNCDGIALYRYDSIFNPDSNAASYVQLELYNLQKIL